jgi:lysophospholipase L1-like esterase
MSIEVNKTERIIDVTVIKKFGKSIEADIDIAGQRVGFKQEGEANFTYIDLPKLEFDDLSQAQKDSLKLTFDQLTQAEKDSLKLTFNDLTQAEKDSLKGEKGDMAIQGEYISYATLADAQAVNPKPSDGTLFQVEEEANKGVYTFQSGEAGGTRYESNIPESNYIKQPRKNLYDISMVSENEWIDQSGLIRSDKSLGLARIPVKPLTTYSFRHNDDSYVWYSENGIAFYDANSQKISTAIISNLQSAGGLGGKTFTTPDNCSFFLHNLHQTEHDYRYDFQLEEGFITTEYETYIGEVLKIGDSYLIDNFSRGKIDDIESKLEEVTGYKGSNYKGETLSQIYDSLDAIRTDTNVNVTNHNNNFTANLNSNRYVVIDKNYSSDAIISDLKIQIGSSTPLGYQFIYIYIVDANYTILQTVGKVDFTVVSGVSVYDLTVNKFILPKNTFIGITCSSTLRFTYGSAVGTSTGWKYSASDDLNYFKNPGEVFFPNGNTLRGDSVGIGWSATLKVFNTVLNNNYLSGLNLTGIGDSMMYGLQGIGYINHIGSRNSMNTTNLGIGGNWISSGGGSGTPMCNRVSEIPLDTEILIIDAGTNDALQNVAIGAENSSNDLEFNGALNKFLDGVLTRIPTAMIMWNSIYQDGKDSYNNAIISACKKRGIPVINNYEEGLFYFQNTAQYNALTQKDNIHFNELGILRNSYKVEGFMRSKLGGFAKL